MQSTLVELVSRKRTRNVGPSRFIQQYCVESGKFEFTVGNEKKIVEAGDGIYMEPDVPHGCICLEAGILIDCFSPTRADFLGKVPE